MTPKCFWSQEPGLALVGSSGLQESLQGPQMVPWRLFSGSVAGVPFASETWACRRTDGISWVVSKATAVLDVAAD